MPDKMEALLLEFPALAGERRKDLVARLTETVNAKFLLMGGSGAQLVSSGLG